jgi:hypothetical protein
MDNYGKHKTPRSRRGSPVIPDSRFTSRPPRRRGSIRSQRWFATLTEKYLRRDTHRSTRQLEDAIRHYLDVYNTNPHPFIWSESADEIVASLEQFCVQVQKAVRGVNLQRDGF